MRHKSSNRQRSEVGVTTVEAVLLAPLLMLLILFVVFLGRIATTRQQVQRAARDAARAATISLTRDDAAAAIETSHTDNLGRLRQHCTLTPVDLSAIGTDTGGEDWDFGLIQIRLTCAIPTGDLGLLALGNKTFTAVATEPVDIWRSRPVNT